MSSAILYFAIVAIWAGILMPRWLRPSAHRHRAEEAPHETAAPEAMATFAQPGLEAAEGERTTARTTEDGERITARTTKEGERTTARTVEDSEHAAAQTAETTAARRANVLRARRRMLTTLVVLTLGAIGIAVTHIAAWWVIVPPAVLLGGFLLLLREAARSDAARARRQARSAEPEQAEAGQRAQARGPGGQARGVRAHRLDPRSAGGGAGAHRGDHRHLGPGQRPGVRPVHRRRRARRRRLTERPIARAGPGVCYADTRSRGCSAVR